MWAKGPQGPHGPARAPIIVFLRHTFLRHTFRFYCFAKRKTYVLTSRSAAPKEQKRTACFRCLNFDFALQLLPMATANPQEFWDLMVTVATRLRVGSGPAERSHIIGQHLKPLNSRGVAIDAQALAATTYRLQNVRQADELTSRVRSDIMTKQGSKPSDLRGVLRGQRIGVGGEIEVTHRRCGRRSKSDCAVMLTWACSGRLMGATV